MGNKAKSEMVEEVMEKIMTEMKNILHFEQEAPHEPLKIFCNLEALNALIKILEAAFRSRDTVSFNSKECFYPSDGEGYNIQIVLSDWDTVKKIKSPYYRQTVEQYIEAIKCKE